MDCTLHLFGSTGNSLVTNKRLGIPAYKKAGNGNGNGNGNGKLKWKLAR